MKAIRIITLVVLMVVALLGIICESDIILPSLASKAVAAAAALILVVLYRKWRREGYMDDIERFVNED